MTDIAPGTIGQSLRNRRLQNNKTIEDVADATRIQAKFLKALEEERWAELPARVFLDGFLVKYAEFLGLDGKDLLRQLRQQLGQTDKPAFTNPEPVPEAAGGGGSLLQIRLPFVMLGVVLVILAGFYFYRSQQERPRPGSLNLNNVNDTQPLPAVLSSSATAPTPAVVEHTATVRAQNLVWLRVWADNVVKFEGTLNAGETRRWTFQSLFRLRAGNLSRVVMDVDGGAVPTSSSSNPGEVVWPGINGERATLTLSAPAVRPVARPTATIPVLRSTSPASVPRE